MSQFVGKTLREGRSSKASQVRSEIARPTRAPLILSCSAGQLQISPPVAASQHVRIWRLDTDQVRMIGVSGHAASGDGLEVSCE